MLCQDTVFCLWGHWCEYIVYRMNEHIAMTHSLQRLVHVALSCPSFAGILVELQGKFKTIAFLLPEHLTRVKKWTTAFLLPLWEDLNSWSILFGKGRVATLAVAAPKACAYHCPAFLYRVPEATWYSAQKCQCLKAEILKVRSRPVRLRPRCATRRPNFPRRRSSSAVYKHLSPLSLWPDIYDLKAPPPLTLSV